MTVPPAETRLPNETLYELLHEGIEDIYHWEDHILAKQLALWLEARGVTHHAPASGNITVARLYERALNAIATTFCEKRFATGKPCEECDSCYARKVLDEAPRVVAPAEHA